MLYNHAVYRCRYLAICYPLHSRALRTPRNALASIGLVWLLALLFSGPYLSYYQQVELAGAPVCVPVWKPAARLAMDLCTFAFGYLLPFAVLSLTYACTVRHLWTAHSTTGTGGGGGGQGAAVKGTRTSMSAESRRAKRRVTKLLIAVAALFCVCWLPHHALILCMWWLGPAFPLNHTTYTLRVLSHLVAYANSCLNPVVYALVSRHFRQGFGRLLCCHALRRSSGRRSRRRRRRGTQEAVVHTASSAEETSN